MAQVYLGQSYTGKRVAIKVIRSDITDDPVLHERFAREVQAARSISALYTAPIVDANVTGSMPWFATTYVEGPSLDDEVIASGPLSVPSVLILAAGLAEAFIAIHRAGLVHRDLKPANVLLTKDGPCVIDFGIALVPNTASLTAGTPWILGTPAFMSPEHLTGGDVGPASDIYSLGATLTFAATGKGPLGPGSPHTMIAKLMAGQIDISAVPDRLKPIIARCLARDPRYRPSAVELLSILSAAGATHPYQGWYAPRSLPLPLPPSGPPSSGGPLGAKPVEGGPSPLYGRLPARRSRVGLWVALSVLAVLLLGGGVATAAWILAGGGSSPVWTAPAPTVRSTTPPARLSLTAPAAVAGLTRSTDTALQASADQLVSEIRTQLDGERSAVAAFYTDPRSAGRRVLFIGITADIVSPTREIDATFTSVNQGSTKIGNIVEVPAGPLGGKAKCGNGKTGEVSVVVCVWADNESLGLGVFYNRPAAESADLFIRIRQEVSHRD
jgi:serine/threonine protein kinase